MVDQVISADAGSYIDQLLTVRGPSEPAGSSMPATLAAALAAVQAEIPEVIKAEKAKIEGKEGRRSYEYSYADLGAVTRTILPRLGRYGLSWLTKPTMLDGKFVLVYKLLHASGESEEGIYPLPDRGSPQEIGSAITYARRYTLCSVTGVAPADDDDAAEATAGYHRNQQAPQEAPAKVGMSRFESDAGLAFLAIPTAEIRERISPAQMAAAFQQTLDFRLCLDEHGAWNLPSDGKDSPTWADRFTARVADEIEAADTGEQLNTLWRTLKAIELDMEHDGKWFTQLIKERGAAIKERNAKALDTITGQILAATTLEDLSGPVLQSLDAAHLMGRMSDDDRVRLMQIWQDRHDRLERGQENVSIAYDHADAQEQFDARGTSGHEL